MELDDGLNPWLPAYGFFESFLKSHDGADLDLTNAAAQYVYLETIQEETSDDLRSDTSNSTSTLFNSDEETTEEDEEEQSDRETACPAKRAKRHEPDADLLDVELDDPQVPSRSSSLLQFESLEKECTAADSDYEPDSLDEDDAQQHAHRRVWRSYEDAVHKAENLSSEDSGFNELFFASRSNSIPNMLYGDDAHHHHHQVVVVNQSLHDGRPRSSSISEIPMPAKIYEDDVRREDKVVYKTRVHIGSDDQQRDGFVAYDGDVFFTTSTRNSFVGVSFHDLSVLTNDKHPLVDRFVARRQRAKQLFLQQYEEPEQMGSVAGGGAVEVLATTAYDEPKIESAKFSSASEPNLFLRLSLSNEEEDNDERRRGCELVAARQDKQTSSDGEEAKIAPEDRRQLCNEMKRNKNESTTLNNSHQTYGNHVQSQPDKIRIRLKYSSSEDDSEDGEFERAPGGGGFRREGSYLEAMKQELITGEECRAVARQMAKKLLGDVVQQADDSAEESFVEEKQIKVCDEDVQKTPVLTNPDAEAVHRMPPHSIFNQFDKQLLNAISEGSSLETLSVSTRSLKPFQGDDRLAGILKQRNSLGAVSVNNEPAPGGKRLAVGPTAPSSKSTPNLMDAGFEDGVARMMSTRSLNHAKEVHFSPIVAEVQWHDDHDGSSIDEDNSSLNNSPSRNSGSDDRTHRPAAAKATTPTTTAPPTPTHLPPPGPSRSNSNSSHERSASAAAAVRPRTKMGDLLARLTKFPFIGRRSTKRRNKRDKLAAATAAAADATHPVNAAVPTPTSVRIPLKPDGADRCAADIVARRPPPVDDVAAGGAVAAARMDSGEPGASCLPAAPGAGAASASGWLFETDLDTQETRAVSSVSCLFSDRREPFDPGQHLLRSGNGSGSATRRRPHKSMEFLLDKANAQRIEPPENELQKVVKERVMSEHQMRVQRSLQKLNVPEWYTPSTVPPEGFLLLRKSSASELHNQHQFDGQQKPRGSWQGNNLKASSPTSWTNSLGYHQQPFVRWSTSKLNTLSSTASSPCASTRSSFRTQQQLLQPNGSVSPSTCSLRSSFSYRQPYMGWRSQERLSNPRTPAERLANSLKCSEGRSEEDEIQSSIKAVTSAIVHYVTSQHHIKPPHDDDDDINEERLKKSSTSSICCWMESSFVGSRPMDSLTPQTPQTPLPPLPPPRNLPLNPPAATPTPATPRNTSGQNGDLKATLEDVLDSLLGLPNLQDRRHHVVLDSIS